MSSELPAEFLDRLKLIVPPSRYDDVVRTFTLERPTTFRVNTLKATPEAMLRRFSELGIKLERVSWLPIAFIVKHARDREIAATEAYQRGEIYVQGLSSMIPPLVLNPHPGEMVLDLTAAPGSKTTQMAAMMANQGTIIANDNNKIRFYKLLANLKLQGASCVQPVMRYGESLWKQYPEHFDKVLLDAPCSAEGRFNAREPETYHYWKPRKITEMARKQRKLLASAIRCLKPGGTLVYSTCTFAPEENEAIIDEALTKFGDAVRLEPIALPLPNRLPGLLRWDGRTFHPSLALTCRLLPTVMMEGFFLAKLTKISEG